jgi:phosphoglucosamine mutase
MHQRQLFGTDGIRGIAHEFPLDSATMFALGEALAHRLKNGGGGTPRVLIGMDTRESGPEIASALFAGIRRGGGEPVYIGVVPTPAVAYLCRTSEAAAAISISASHNPYHDNGVKIFGHDGMKLSDALEKQIEEELLAIRREGESIERESLVESAALIGRYEDFLLDCVGEGTLRGMRIVLDTGHGASFAIGPEVFRRAGAEVIVMHAEPDGTNINEGAGALHPERLAARVVEEGARLGIAFDGDADRAIFIDDAGAVRNGDEILFLWGIREKREGRLANDTIVATVMSNLGFEKQLRCEGIRLLRAQVGDKYVLETMLHSGAVLGGEQSGHLIDLNVHTTGDGLHTGLAMSALLSESETPFSCMQTFTPMPQVLLNERVRAKPPLETLPGYASTLEECERTLSGRGRILVRYSGTENLVRVMVEGESEQEIRDVAARLVDALRSDLS